MSEHDENEEQASRGKQGGSGGVVSREHTDGFLAHEQREIAVLAAELGREVVGKLDRVLLRELIYERRQRAFAAAVGGPAPPPVRHRVVVTLSSGAAPREGVRTPHAEERQRVVAELRRSGEQALDRLESELRDGEVRVVERFWLTHSVLVELTAEQLRDVAGRQDVAHVVLEKERILTLLDGSRPLIGADQVEASLGFSGSGVLVAVVDTGIDAAHPALAGVVVSQQDFTGAGGATAEGTGDMVGHGTHCAGIVASQDKTFRGIAPGAQLADVKIMRNNGAGDGTGTVASTLAGITAVVQMSARVASCSFGFTHANNAWQDPPAAGQPDGTCVICTAVDNAVAAGVVFAVAAGNDDNDSCQTFDTHLNCPGLAAGAITVAASDKSDNMAGFSSVGPTPQGRAKPDVTAPGVSIGSCRASGTSMGSPIDANFTRLDGTSMATPHIAGVAALMLSKTASLAPASVKDKIMTTAHDLGAPANQQGTGRVDALAAVNAS
jgi:serine protease AprX